MNHDQSESTQPDLVPATVPHAQVALQSAPVNAYELIMRAMSDERCDPEKLQKLLDVRQQMEADEARKAFARDWSGFQSECPSIQPLDRSDKGAMAKLERILIKIKPIKVKYGIDTLWNDVRVSDDFKVCHLRGFITHRSGYTLPASFDCPLPEAVLAKSSGQPISNIAQRMGGATTYGRRYAEAALYNLIISKDDAGIGDPALSPEHLHTLRVLCADAKQAEHRVAGVYGKATLEELPEDMYQAAYNLVRSKLPKTEAAQ